MLLNYEGKTRSSAVRIAFMWGALLVSGACSTAMAQSGWQNPCGTTTAVVYDAIQGLCWMADANLAGDPAIQAALGVTGINPNGTMDFPTALNWVAALNAYNNGRGYLGHNNWQLPVMPLQDNTCGDTGPQGASFGPLCTGSAQGDLYSAGLNETYPNSVAPGFAATVAPLHNVKLSYYWALQNNGGPSGGPGGGQEVFSFANGQQGGVTIKDTYFYVLPMVAGAIGTAPSCTSGSAVVVPYTSGPAAGKAVYDCSTKYTWLADANLAASANFGITGDITIAFGSRSATVPKIDRGAMLVQTAAQWVQAMNAGQYLGSSAWQIPASSQVLETLFKDLNLVHGDPRLMSNAGAGPFQNLQPFYYWGCQRDQSGNSQSPCVDDAPPDGTTSLQWSFNFDSGFQATSALTQRFFTMVYYPAPVPACLNPIQCCAQAGGTWTNGHCE